MGTSGCRGANMTRIEGVGPLLDILKVSDAEVHSAFRVGSWVYGCATESSDEDFLVVLHQGKRDLVFRPGINITVHTVESFEASLAGHSMFALECLFAPKEAQMQVSEVHLLQRTVWA